MDVNMLFRKLIFYINKFVDEKMDELLKSIVIYLIFCKNFRYNAYYTIFGKLNSNYDIQENEIICNQFANLFCRVLDYYRIPSFICETGKHTFVRLNIRTMNVVVDPLKFGYNDEGEFLLSDFTNVKMGFRVTGLVLDKSTYINEEDYQKDLNILNNAIDECYKILDYSFSADEQMSHFFNNFYNNMIKRVEVKNNAGNNFIDLEELDYRIGLLNSFNGINGHTVENMQFIKKYFLELFRDNIDLGGEFISLYKRDGNTILLHALIVLYDELGNVYYYLQGDNGIVRYTKDSIVELMFKNNLFFKFVNDVDALDLDDDRKFKLIRQSY